MDKRKVRPKSASSVRRMSSSSAGSAALVAEEDVIQDVPESVAIREAKIREWMQRKEILDKGLELFSRLDSRRAESEESLRRVAMTAYAIDALSGVASDKNNKKDTPPPSESIAEPKMEEKQKPVQKTLKHVWLKWARDNHTFSNVKFTASEVSAFSATLKEFLEPAGDDFVLLSLKYSFPAKPKPNEKPKPLTSDQQLQNAAFNKQCMRVWKEARAEVEKSVNAANAADHKSSSDAKDSSSRTASSSRQSNSLYAFGLPRLRLWIEEDEDVAQERAKEAASERASEKKIAYEGFVKKKDSLRIKLPPQEVVDEMAKRGKLRPQSAPRMHFGRELQVVRPKSIGAPLTTAELMATSGLKYVHATKRGQGIAGDLELSRKKLLDMGFVDKANIEVDPDSGNSLRFLYEKTREENDTLKELKKNFEKTQNESGKAFEQWVALKACRDQALKFLSHIDPPTVPNDDPDAKPNSKAVIYNSPLVDRCIEVGKALKRVDRTLFTEWSRWCAGIIPPANATILWDSFFPMACDIHGVLGSMVREAFLKLLKPGFNYQETFRYYAEKKVRKAEAQERTRYSDEERNKRIAETKLNRKEMTRLLLDLGLSLNPNEVIALIEAFDTNCDGSVSMQEFLDFIGPIRTTNAGALAALNQKCCWRTTCKKTGMSNAYTICQPSGKRISLENDENDGGNFSGSRYLIANTETITLATGEKRLRMELLERQRHEDLLKKYKLLSSDSPKRKSRSSRRAESKSQSPTRDNYDTDEFEKDDEYADEFEKNNDINNNSNQKCAVVTLTMEDRKKGLKYLDEMTKETRQEKALKALLSNGEPPAAPKLWVVQSKDPDAKDEDIDFSTELWIKWEPKLNDLVSFFSLEFGGPVGSVDTKYREVYRDPPDANPESLFKFNYRLTDLQPGTSYLLRIRGINGYGPGDFTYKTFATYPAPPIKPRVERITPTSTTLRWVFSKVYMKRIADLKALFESIDEDKSGAVSRKELADALDQKANGSSELKSFLHKMRVENNIPDNLGFIALFDTIEGDDDELISWEEFEAFFINAGWCEAIGARSTAQDPDGTGTEKRMKACAADEDVRGSRSGALSTSQSQVSRVTYVVEKCVSEFDDAYKEVLRTTLGECTINHLESGQSYRFRVYAINADGGKGDYSETIIVHAKLETPPPPTLATRWNGAIVQANSIVLQWRSRRHGITSRNPLVVKKMIGDWTGAGEDEGGVSVEAAFAKYDINGDGTMDIAEFRSLLEDLGVECTKERLSYAFSLFDTNKDGILSFAEFSAFWRRDEVTYTLKRSEPINPTTSFSPAAYVGSVSAPGSKASHGVAQGTGRPESRGSRRPSSASANPGSGGGRPSTAVKKQTKDAPTPVTSYRAGSDLIFEERGLIPNSLYYFKLRYVGSKVNSALSAPLAIMTAPLAPSAPLVIRVTNSSVKLKWYAPKYGAFKFELQLSVISSVSGLTSASGEWNTVYSGQETFFMSTTLSSETVYNARVVALNYQGAPSVASPVITFKTPSRTDSKDDLLPKNITSAFPVECVSDICVGDIILISERLFAKQRSTAENAAGLGGVDAPQSMTVKKSGVVRMDMSVTSVTGSQPPPGSYIGERTIAAHVVRDNYRTYRDSTGSNKVDVLKFINSRRLWLEVIWEKSSSEACKAYKLSPGTVIERTQSHFEQFEVFRTAWADETGRLPFASEIQSLEDCFTAPDL